MTVQQDVLARAASRIGYYAPNDPQPGSEAGRYWANKVNQAWLAGPSKTIWWCMLFVSMVFDEAGQVDAIGGWTYNTDVCISHARARGLPFVTAAQAHPGDVVIFNWNGGPTDHVGVVERNLGGGWIQTIEGNTSSGAAGSQSAGNGVWRRRRHDSIAAIIRPAWRDGSLAASSSTAPAALSVDGWWGQATTRRLQQVLGTPVDGVVSSQSAAWRSQNPGLTTGWEWTGSPVGSQLIQALQRKLSVEADGLIGPGTIRALQARMGTPQDGVLSEQSQCITALQQRLQKGTL